MRLQLRPLLRIGFHLAATAPVVFGQTPRPSPGIAPPPEVLPLVLIDASHTRTTTPASASVGNERCDASGNIFFSVGTPNIDGGPYRRVSADGRQHTSFALPRALSRTGHNLWSVTPDGSLYVLHNDEHESKLVRFSHGGEVEDAIPLTLPRATVVQAFAIADNGSTLVEDYRNLPENTSPQKPGFAAFFDPTGTLLRDLSAAAPPMDISLAATELPEGDLIAGEDGRFYDLTSDAIRIIDRFGEPVMTLKLNKPNAQARAARIDASGGYLSVVFLTPIPPAKPGWATLLASTAVLIGAQSGSVQRVITFGPNLTGTVACYSAASGYTLLAVDNNQMLGLDRVSLP